jgi:hypothetical protein
VVTDAVGHACCVKSLTEHEAAGFLKAQPLLELQGAHSGDGFEVVVESRDAHPELAGDALDPKRLIKVLVEALNRPGDVGSVAPVTWTSCFSFAIRPSYLHPPT